MQQIPDNFVALLEQDLPQYPLGSAGGTLQALAATVRGSTGGTSGALYDILFTAAAAALRDAPDGGCGAEGWGRAAAAAVAAVQRYSGARPGDRTMLDALVPASQALASAAGAQHSSLRTQCYDVPDRR